MTQRELNQQLLDLIEAIGDPKWWDGRNQHLNDYINKFVDSYNVAHGDKVKSDDPSEYFQRSYLGQNVADAFYPDLFCQSKRHTKRPFPIFSHGGISKRYPESDELRIGDTTQLDSFLSSFMNKGEITHESE